MAWFHLHRHLRDAFIPHRRNNYHPHAVRPHMLGAYAAILIGVKIASVAFVSFTTQSAALSEITTTNIVRLTNNERRALHVPVLHSNVTLNKAAQAKANDMFQLQYFAHVSPKNVTPWYWFKQAGYRYQYAGENLAIDFVESEDVVQAWMNSPSHRKNMVNSKYTDIGVAVKTGQFNGANSILVVQMFGTPTPQTTRRVAQGPIQQPTPTAVKQQLAQAAPPTVLGEEQASPEPTPAVAPMIPAIQTPEAGSLVRTLQPEVVGTAEPASHVALQVNDQIVAEGIASAQGVFSLTPATPMTDGQYTLSVSSTARDLSSVSISQRVTVDTKPPAIDTEASFALLSLSAPDTYDIHLAVSPDATNVTCTCGAVTSQLHATPAAYTGTVHLDPKKTTTGILKFTARDAAGNETQVTLANTDLFTSGVVAASASPLVTAFRAISYSRAIMTMFLIVLLILAGLNFFIHIERQHHVSVVGILLVAYLAGSLLIL